MHRYSCWALMALTSCCWTTGFARVALAVESSSSTTSRQAREEAIRAIPFERISPSHRRRIRQVLNDSSLYRRMPTTTVDCHPPLFTFFAENPDVLVQVWRQLGISNVELVRVKGNRFRMTDSVGTVGELVIVERNCNDRAQNRLVMYAEGAYEGKPFKQPVRAQCVLLLRSGSVQETNGRQYVASRLDTFLRIDRVSLELFAKAAHPLVGKMADRNFVDTMNFIGNMSKAAEIRPLTIERLASSLPHVSSDQKRQLVEVTYECTEQDSSLGGQATARLAKTEE